MGLFLIKNILIKTSHLEVFLVFRLGHSLGEEERRGKVPFISHSCQGYIQSAWFVSRIHAVSMVPHCDVDLDHLAEQRLSGFSSVKLLTLPFFILPSLEGSHSA